MVPTVLCNVRQEILQHDLFLDVLCVAASPTACICVIRFDTWKGCAGNQY